jgi:leucyl aminopeptidase
MSVPRLSIVSESELQGGDVGLVLLAAQRSDDGPAIRAGGRYAELDATLRSVGFAAGQDELIRLPGSGDAGSFAVVGLGAEVTATGLRYSIGSALRQLAGVDRVTVQVDAAGDTELLAVLEGAALGAYAFTDFRPGSKPSPVGEVVVVADSEHADALVERATAVAEAVALVKDLVNTPPSHLYPESLAERAVEAASGLPIETRVWDEDELAADGFGGILGVGQGSVRPPRLVKLSYRPKGAARHIALVGKGITFDSGGLSLKPAVSMVGMKYDMTGAATVLGAIVAIARLALPVRVTAWMCVAENMPSGSALRPNDVLTIRGGTTVEVLNTDAEGRLVLADGLVAAGEEKPDAIVDVATLTGAAVVALGSRYAAVMGDEELTASVVESATRSGELLWPMPLPGELRATINSEVADIANANPGNSGAGMLLAGVFLKEFIARTGDASGDPLIPWAHLDIAGPGKSPASPFGFTGKGATGVTVRTLIQLADDYSQG